MEYLLSLKVIIEVKNEQGFRARLFIKGSKSVAN